MANLAGPDVQKYTVKEVLNKALNSGEDALKVDIDNATITAGEIDVGIGHADDSVLIYGYDGSANQKLAVDAQGQLQVDVITSAAATGVQEIEGDEAESSGTLPNPILVGGDDGTDVKNINVDSSTGDVQVDVTNTVSIADGGNVISVDDAGGALTVDGTITVQDGGNVISVDDGGATLTVDGTITATQSTAGNLNMTEANSAGLLTKATTVAGAVTGTEMQVDVVAALPTGTNTVGSVKVTDGSQTVDVNGSNQMEVNVNSASGLEVVQNTAGDFNVTEASASSMNTHLDNMMWTAGLEVTPADGSDLTGAPFYSVYVGGGGTLRVNTGASAGGSDLEFVNVASGTVIPMLVHRVYSTVSAGTVASSIVVLK